MKLVRNRLLWTTPALPNSSAASSRSSTTAITSVRNVVRTWAPAGQTPLHRHRQGRRDKISVISGISLSPRRHRLCLYYLLFFDNIGQEEVLVREWLRHLRGPLILLLDKSSTHKGNPIAHLQRQHPRLHIEYFPSY